jgi:hypothetical protein
MGQTFYTQADAPDDTSRLVLRRWVNTMSGAKADNTKIDASGIHLNFAQVIEQNFARMHSAQAEFTIVQMSDKELQDLAGFYDQSIADTGHEAQLMNVLNLRVSASALARINGAFAAAQTAALANGGRVRTMFDRSQGQSGRLYAPPQGNWLDYTPQEIYLDLRTMPIGARSVPAALLEAGSYIGRNIFMAFWEGYAAGTLLNNLIVEYDPKLDDDIGELIYNAVNWITAQGSSWWNYGRAQQNLGQVFNYDEMYGTPVGVDGSIEMYNDYSCSFGWDTGYDMGGYDGAGGGGGGAWPYDNMER